MKLFELFDIEPSFFLDATKLRKKFYALSREFHPDHNSDEDIIQKSALCNEAYNTLKEKSTLIPYILREFNVLNDTDKEALDPMFLMEMMELNENLESLQIASPIDTQSIKEFETQCETMLEEIWESSKPDMQNFDFEQPNIEILEGIKKVFFRYKYLLRFQENLNKFAAA